MTMKDYFLSTIWGPLNANQEDVYLFFSCSQSLSIHGANSSDREAGGNIKVKYAQSQLCKTYWTKLNLINIPLQSTSTYICCLDLKSSSS